MQKEGYEVLYLSLNDVKNIDISVDKTMQIIRDTYIAKSNGSVQYPPGAIINFDDQDYVSADPVWITTQEYFGASWYGIRRNNYKKNLPNYNGIIVINRRLTGAPLAIMDQTYISQISTGATAALCAKLLVRKGCENIGLLGFSNKGISCLKSILASVPNIKRVYILDTENNAADCLNNPSISVVKTDAEKVVRNADILITARESAGELFVCENNIAGWLKEDCLMISVDGDQCIDYAAIEKKSSKFVTDDVQKFNLAGNIYKNMYTKTPEAFEEIVSGKNEGRNNDSQIIYCCLLGASIIDVAIAHELYKRAQKEQIGKLLEIF